MKKRRHMHFVLISIHALIADESCTVVHLRSPSSTFAHTKLSISHSQSSSDEQATWYGHDGVSA